METVKTKTGKEFETDYYATIPYPAQAYIRIFSPLPEVAAVFADPTETETITIGDIELTGYVKLIALVMEGDVVKVCLAKEG